MYLRDFWPLNLSTTTVYARSAFYPSLRFTLSLQSAFCTQSAFYPWSAVCSLRFTLTDLKTCIFTPAFNRSAALITRCRMQFQYWFLTNKTASIMRKKWVSKLRKGNLFVIYIGLQKTATTTTTTKCLTLTIPPSILGSLQRRHHFNHHIFYFSSIDTTTFLLSFSSTTTTTTFIMLSLRCYYRHYKSINPCKPLRLVNFSWLAYWRLSRGFL